MSRLRVLMVWCVAISAILIVYRLYNRVSRTPQIETPSKEPGEELVIPEFDPDAPKIGSTTIGNVKQSRYTVRDEKTKKLKQVFGFEKLLNPQEKSRKWPLLKPYMNMYEDSFTCRITSEKGTVQVETVNNNPTPTEAELYENVVIRIRPVDPSDGGESTIYMDHLSYNSERSEFSTDGPLRLVSEGTEMEGRGMMLIYNSGMNRIEFLKIVELDYLRVKNAADLSVGKKEESGSGAAGAAGAAPTVVKVNEPVESQPKRQDGDKPVAPAASVARKQAASGGEDETPIAAELYLCTLSEDVSIKYGDVVIVQGRDRVSISNILLSRGRRKKAGETATAAPAVAAVTPVEKSVSDESTANVEMKTVTAAGTSVTAKETAGARPVEEARPSVEVYVTCKGGIIAKPMTSVYENTEPAGAQAVGEMLLAGKIEGRTPGDSAVTGTVEKAAGASDESAVGVRSGYAKKPPDRFRAKLIQYDMSTGAGLGHGPVEAMFYPDPNDVARPNEIVFPMTVAASKNAEFFANDNRMIDRVVFNSDVVGTRKTVKPECTETNSFKGEKLTVNIDQSEGPSKGNVGSIAITEGNVMLESVRKHEDTVIGHVRLSCVRIDYDGVKKIVYAVGPGNIQMNNENAPQPDSKDKPKGLSFQQPCFGLVRGFDKLTWFTEAMQINADGKDESVFMAYWPIENGKRGRITRGSTTHLQTNFIPLPDGTNELATMIAAGGIYFEEVGGNIFVGENLLYKADTSLLTITSSQKNTCLLNGALVDMVEYEVDTGNVRSELASSPGALTLPAGEPNQK
jgi:hypothetical protein